MKIPKQYHDDYEDVLSPHSSGMESLIDPLIPIETIKTEPIDVVENDISEAMETQFIDTNGGSGASAQQEPETEVNPLEVNPLEMEADGEKRPEDSFLRIHLTSQPPESAVDSIQISECHSMNPEEQAEESRALDGLVVENHVAEGGENEEAKGDESRLEADGAGGNTEGV